MQTVIVIQYNSIIRQKQSILLSIISLGYGKIKITLTYEEYLLSEAKVYKQNMYLPSMDVTTALKAKFVINVTVNKMLQGIQVLEFKQENVKIAHESKNCTIDIEQVPCIFEKSTNPSCSIPAKFEILYSLSQNDVPHTMVSQSYFAHVFRPILLFPKHVIFVIGISGSANYQAELKLTKEALYTIIASLTSKDYFNIITYSNGVSIWPHGYPLAQRGTVANKRAAVNHIQGITARADTDINAELVAAMELAKVFKNDTAGFNDYDQFIFFVTSIHPGTHCSLITTLDDVVTFDYKTPIHTLAFGNDTTGLSIAKYISLASNGTFHR